jgi:Domain of unknown function (DUF3854)
LARQLNEGWKKHEDKQFEGGLVMNLRDSDLSMFERLGIPAELLVLASVERITDQAAREEYLITGCGDKSGLIFPYIDPRDGRRTTARLRRDNPEIEAGRPKRKYVSAFGDRRHLYFPPGSKEPLADPTVPIILVEAEKSALALTAFAQRVGRKCLPVAMGGCWGWRGRIGKVENRREERVDETGPLPDLAVCRNRDVVVMLDSNADAKSEVRAARFALARELNHMGARVRIARVPPLDGVNGPDDLIAVGGDEALSSVLELAQPSAEVVAAEVEAAIGGILAAKPDVSAEHMRRALDAVANVSDHIERTMLESRIAAAVRGVVPKDTIISEVSARRQECEVRQQDFSTRNREAELRAIPVDAVRLIEEIETFFADRAHLPEGAARVLSYFALNTWTFRLFDTVPYLLLESAVPGCGKSTVMRLLSAISFRSRKASSLSEAVMFRLINAEAPTLLIDEAETIDGRSERAEGLRAIAHEGYKQGGQVPRCDGDDHEVRWFDVHCPKVFAAIGGLTGALLDRCVVIHIEKAPKGSARKSTRCRVLHRDVRDLIVKLEAYTLQSSDALRRLYDDEPDCGYWPSITDREAELWGPLLIHARLAGPDSEAKLIAVVDKFSEEKAEIKSADSKIAKTIALLDAISKHPDSTFTPGDVVPMLAQSEAWGRTLAEVKGRDDDSVRISQAAKVGYFLRNFRLRGKKNGTGHMAYESEAAIDCLSAHAPQNPPKPPQPPSQNHQVMELAGNGASPEGTEAKEGFGCQSPESGDGNQKPSERQRLDLLNSAITEVTVLPNDKADRTNSEMMEGEI